MDPEARLIEAYRLGAGSYVLAVRWADHEPFSAEPLGDLAFTASTIWA